MAEMSNMVDDSQYAKSILNDPDVFQPEYVLPRPPKDWDEAGAKSSVKAEDIICYPLGAAFLKEVDGSDNLKETLEVAQLLRRVVKSGAVSEILANQIKSTFPSLMSSINARETDGRTGSFRGTGSYDEEKTLEQVKLILASVVKDAQSAVDKFKSDSGKFSEYLKLKWFADQPVDSSMIKKYRVLGRGAFGMVQGSSIFTVGRMLALKAMNKQQVHGMDCIDVVTDEQKALMVLSDNPHPFVLDLLYSFKDSENFYLALPLAIGGDLQYHLLQTKAKKTRGFPPKRTRFYAAEICAGVVHMHDCKILYRDLKPENILVDDKGHCKISDLGLAKLLKTRTSQVKGRAGTPGYMAPEVIKGSKYGTETDWWGFGVLLYELFTSYCAFDPKHTKTDLDRNKASVEWEIKLWEQRETDLDKEKPIPPEALDLIMKCLNRNQEERIGAGLNGGQEIMAHPYFEEINWGELQKKNIAPTWKPERGKLYVHDQNLIETRDKAEMYKDVDVGSDSVDYQYVNMESHQRDLLQLRQLIKDGKVIEKNLKRPPGEAKSGSCAIS